MKTWHWLVIGGIGIGGLFLLLKSKNKATLTQPPIAEEVEEPVYIEPQHVETQVPTLGITGGTTVDLGFGSIPISQYQPSTQTEQTFESMNSNQAFSTPQTPNIAIPTSPMISDEDAKRTLYPQYQYIGKVVRPIKTGSKSFYIFIKPAATPISNYEAFTKVDEYLGTLFNATSVGENVLVYESQAATPVRLSVTGRIMSPAKPRVIEASAYMI